MAAEPVPSCRRRHSLFVEECLLTKKGNGMSNPNDAFDDERYVTVDGFNRPDEEPVDHNNINSPFNMEPSPPPWDEAPEKDDFCQW